MAEWAIDSAERIDFDEAPEELSVSMVGGELSIAAAAEGPGSLEVSQVIGPEVQVRLQGGRLQISQRPEGWGPMNVGRVSASVALSIPASCRARVETVSASVLVEGLEAEAELESVSGELTLEGLHGPVEAKSVSGAIAARGESGEFKGQTVSGQITLDAYGGDSVRLQSVSGEVVADLKQSLPEGSVKVDTVSGKVYLQLAPTPSQTVKVGSVSGKLVSSFPGLKQKSSPGSHSLKGTLGEGRGSLRVETVSGSVSLLGEGEA